MTGRRLYFVLFAVALLVTALATTATADPFEQIRIGDIDGIGYGTGAGYFAANGGPANVDGLGDLTDGDFIPDLNGDNVVATGSRDDFDNRSLAEKAGNFVTGVGFYNAGSCSGSQFTDIALSTSFDATFPPPNDFPTPPSMTRPNQPGFVFDFMVAGGDIYPGIPLYLNVIFGDYDVVPADLLVTPAAGAPFKVPLSTQPPSQDGLIQAAYATIAFADVFVASGSDWYGHVEVDFLAPNEPYTAFDFAEVSVDSIVTTTLIDVDIKPRSCPNPLNVKFKGYASTAGDSPLGAGGALPVAILGTDELDVTTIDPATVQLAGVDPIRWHISDVAAPVVDGEPCECTTAGPDGYDDLTLKFNKSEIIAAIGAVENGDVVELELIGKFYDGYPFIGSDCVLIRAKTPDNWNNTSLLAAGIENGLGLINQPNPFNAGTNINYLTTIPGHVTLTVYNVLGQHVVTLVDAEQSAGEYSVAWDGRDGYGRDVASGIYLCRLQVSDLSLTRKMTLMK
jgi:hypothetical protein